jgi:hypothetical protein
MGTEKAPKKRTIKHSPKKGTITRKQAKKAVQVCLKKRKNVLIPQKIELDDDPVRVFALVGDMHVGSRFALFPEEFRSFEGNVLSAALNAGQKKLLEYWHQFVDICDEYQVDTVCLLGDIMNGRNPRGLGYGQVTPDMDEQVDAAFELLVPLCRSRTVCSIAGTDYHQSLEVRLHKTLAEKLKDIALKSKFHGFVGNFKVKNTNRIMNVQHGASGAVYYLTTVMERNIWHARVKEVEQKLPHIDIFIKGHWHIWAHIDVMGTHAVQVPCWAMWHPWKSSLTYYTKMQPDIGAALLFVDRKSRIKVWHFKYQLPVVQGKLEAI